MKKRLLSAMLMMILVLGTFQIPAYADSVLVWPVPASRTLSQGFHDNNAIDISAAQGSAVVAAKSGTVIRIYLCTSTHYNYGDCNGFGTGLVILGDDGRAYQYAHMQAGSIPSNVYRGARVEAGQQIGRVGQTGYAYGPHLHFGISNTANYWEAGPNPWNETYGSTTVDPGSIKVGNQSATNITRTNARLAATLYKVPGATASACGIYLGKTQSSMSKRNTESVGSAANNHNGGNSFDIWYDLTGELRIVLEPGTRYYYKVYCVVNGREYQGAVASFVTDGTTSSETTPKTPTITVKQNNTITASNVTRNASSWAQSFTIGAKQNGNGKLTYQSNSRYVTVDGNGSVTIAANYSATATIRIFAAETGTYKAAFKDITVTVKKKVQPMILLTGNKIYTRSAVKKSAKTFTIGTLLSQGKVTCTSNSRYIKISGKKVTVQKGTPKGTYQIRVTASGNSVYAGGTKVIKIRIK